MRAVRGEYARSPGFLVNLTFLVNSETRHTEASSQRLWYLIRAVRAVGSFKSYLSSAARGSLPTLPKGALAARAGLPLAVGSERMVEPRPKRERAYPKGHGEGLHEEAPASMDKIKTVRFKNHAVSARVMLHQIQLVPDPRARIKLLLQAMRVCAEKMSVLNAESAFGKMLALNLCGDEEKFQDDQIQRRLQTLQKDCDLFEMEQAQQKRAHFPGHSTKAFHDTLLAELAAPPAELGLGLGYYPSAKKQRGEGSSRD